MIFEVSESGILKAKTTFNRLKELTDVEIQITKPLAINEVDISDRSVWIQALKSYNGASTSIYDEITGVYSIAGNPKGTLINFKVMFLKDGAEPIITNDINIQVGVKSTAGILPELSTSAKMYNKAFCDAALVGTILGFYNINGDKVAEFDGVVGSEPNAPGTYFLRKEGAWVSVPDYLMEEREGYTTEAKSTIGAVNELDEGKAPEVPNDGINYVRSWGEWVEQYPILTTLDDIYPSNIYRFSEDSINYSLVSITTVDVEATYMRYSAQKMLQSDGKNRDRKLTQKYDEVPNVLTIGAWANSEEYVANKSIDQTLGGEMPSDVKYPSQKAAKTYVDNLIGVLSNLTTTVKTNIVAAINEIIDKIGKENGIATLNSSQKVVQLPAALDTDHTMAANSDTAIASQKAIKKYADDMIQLTIKGELSEGLLSPVIQVIGDSTGNSDDEWVYLLGQKIATAYPTHNVKYASYNTGTNKYDAWRYIQNVGDDRHIRVNGSTGGLHFLRTQDVAITSPDLDVAIRVSLDNWQPSNSPVIVGKMGSPDNCWQVRIISNKIYLQWYADGVTQIGSKNTGVDTSTWVANSEHWIRVTLDVDNGSSGHTVTGYTSSDGVTWTGQTPVVTAGLTSLNATNSLFNFYVMGGNYSAPLANGKYYAFILRDGIDGPVASPQPIDLFTRANSGTVASELAGTPTVYIYNASISGYSTTHFNDATLIGKCVPVQQGSMFLSSLSHNDSSYHSTGYLTLLDTYFGLVKSRIIAPDMYVMTQNPKMLPAGNITDQALRRRILMSYAKTHGFGSIDTYQEFINDGRALSDLIQADGVHPSTAGSQLWANKVWNALKLI